MPAFLTLDLKKRRLQSSARWPEKQKTVGQYCASFKKACETSAEEGSNVLIGMINEIHLKHAKYSLQDSYERAIKILAFIEFKTINKTPEDFEESQSRAIKTAQSELGLA